MDSAAASKIWTDYNAAQATRPVRPLCVDAMAAAGPGEDRLALDLGCGAGKETRALLDGGWRVHAVDSLPDTRERLLAILPAAADGRLSIDVTPFEDLRALPGADLIFAGYSLPFIHPGRFGVFWRMLLQSLRRSGVIAVNLFGERDSWAGTPEWNFHTEDDARSLFAGLEIVKFDVFDDDGQSFKGPKHWHIFDVIARKP